ncbi:MAG: hypothetical protein HQK50_06915 [Oligoflexia bacterium]|nr:hypothetical protein [Oligoflexia bacterium]MBF0365285.1 hypothetical protein [Oligoflexia bacterium]
MAQKIVSPVTGILEEDKVYVDFGEHEGKSVLEIADTLPDYYSYMIAAKDQGNFFIRRGKDKLFRLYITESNRV